MSISALAAGGFFRRSLRAAAASMRSLDAAAPTLQAGTLRRAFPRLAVMSTWIVYRLALGALAIAALVLLFAAEYGLASAIARREHGFARAPDEQGP